MLLTTDAVLFDSDGVLVDSHDLVRRAWLQLGSELGLDFGSGYGELAGRRPVDTLGAVLPPAEVPRAVDRLEVLELELAADTTAIPGAVDLVGSLPAAAVAFVTSASRPLALARWTAAGLSPPTVAVTAEDTTRGKPDPEPYLVAARLLGVDATRCVAFEDSANGDAAARAAGATVVAVGEQPWAFAPSARVPDLRPVVAAAGENEISLAIGDLR